MTDNKQARKWQITINNPIENGFTKEVINEILKTFFPTYFCGAYEIGESGTEHLHAFIVCHSPIRFSTLKSRLPTAHLERAYGSAKENKDYIQKSGKWADSEKAETSIEGSYFEFGELPTEQSEKSPQMCKLIENVKGDMRTAEIITEMPSLAFRSRDIDILRQTLQAERFTVENRDLTVRYLYGATGTGKTLSIFQKHSPHDIYRITNYRNGKGVLFDGYSAQNVIVFEEFNSQIPIEDMLNILDRYPLFLPARYSDRIAAYETVYITSNLPLNEQYKNVQIYKPETWRALVRRVNAVIEFHNDGTTKERTDLL